MKYMMLVLWATTLFFLMFSAFPSRVECRPPQGGLGPGPPNLRCPYPRGNDINNGAQKQDISVKIWQSRLLFVGQFRSRSEIGPDGSFNVTFDVDTVIKGSAPKRKQFRLQFLDSKYVRRNSHTGLSHSPSFIHSKSSSSTSLASLRSSSSSDNVIRSQVGSTSFRAKKRFESSRRRGGSIKARRTRLSARQMRRRKRKDLRTQSHLKRLQFSLRGCPPPVAPNFKPGRKYYIFADREGPHVFAIFPPAIVNRKNRKSVSKTLCKNCAKAPTVTLGRKSEMVLKPKDRLRLRCRLRSGNPIPNFIWLKDGRVIPDSKMHERRYRINMKRRKSTFVIKKVMAQDAGLYTCETKNMLGSSNASMRVIIQGPSGSTSSVSNHRSSVALSIPSKSHSEPEATTAPATLWPLKSRPCPYEKFCLNGGTCSYYDTIQEYVCQCAEGFKGQRCDTKDVPNTGNRYRPYLCSNHQYPC